MVAEPPQRNLGLTEAQVVGRTHWEVFPASVGTAAERDYRRVMEERVEAHLADHHVGEGYDRYLEIDAYPMDEGGDGALLARRVRPGAGGGGALLPRA